MALSKRALWQKRVDEWVQSALTGPQFADRHGISIHALRWWKRQLLCSDRSRPDAPSTEKAGFSFVELRSEQADGPRFASNFGFELHFGPYRVSIPAGFDASSLLSLLGVLEGRVKP